MGLKLLVRKLAISNKKFITSKELKEDCKKLSLSYYSTICYLTYNKYLARIFKGIFYIYSIEERKLGSSDLSFFDILKKAIKIKGITNWYFGLETALKLNNLTHEYFSVDFIISDSLFRAKPISIMGRKVKFYKISSKLISFGIKNNRLPCSNPEKTVLDMLYLNHYSKPEFEEMAEKLSKVKLFKYAKNYDKKTVNIVKGLK